MKDEARLKSGRERQKRWRKRRKAEGKKAITAILSNNSKEMLEKEKERTGDSFSTTIDKALINCRKANIANSSSFNHIAPLEIQNLKGLDGNTGKGQNKDMFLSFFETATDLMCITDEYGTLTHVNDSFATTLGYLKEEIMGAHITQILPEKTVENRFRPKFEELIDKGRLDFETTWTTKSRKEIYGEEKVVAVYDKNGKFVGTRGVLRDITKRKLAELELKERETELDVKNKGLEEMNTALRVLLKRRDEDKTEIEEKVILNIQELILPYLEKLGKSKLDVRQTSLVNILESNLKDIVSPFARELTRKFLKFTPTEIQVANLVKQGKTTKEIADLLNVSDKTIESHRKNIRNKIGIKNKKENLQTHLLSIFNQE